MSSKSDFDRTESSQSPSRSPSPTRPRLGRPGSTDPNRVRRYDIEGKYNDNYRSLFNEHVTQIAARFHVAGDATYQHYTIQIGSSIWSPTQQAIFFLALERLGKDNIPQIATVVGTKSELEIRAFLLILQDAAEKLGSADLTLRDIPAAVEVGLETDQHLDEFADALAWSQERFDAVQEHQRYGDLWLLTPTVAADIEVEINGLVKPMAKKRSENIQASVEPPRRGVAGACAPCKNRKMKCDRGTPCTRCAKSGVDCVYPKNPPEIVLEKPEESANGPETPILSLIPEAKLLQPQTMLTLSKHYFMNRSPDIPSPWPHWSEYASKLASEPSIYRTAFNDFHRLAVSVTKRLVQTSIVQANSRLRAQRRRRDEKGLSPFVKTRDVLTAIDILGLRRNGSERWKSVARRCNLRVLGQRRSPRSRKREEISWNDVERILNMTMPQDEALTTDNLTTRAGQRGPPQHMQNLTLSDPEQGSESSRDDDDSARNGGDSGAEDEQLSVEPHTDLAVQLRDTAGRFRGTSLAPQDVLFTLEKFDQEARHQGDTTLRRKLGLPVFPEKTSKVEEEKAGLELNVTEKLYTEPNNWRASTEYRAPWEEFDTLPTINSFLANGKYDDSVAAARASTSDSDTSSSSISKRPVETSRTPAELQPRGTNAYAALQGAQAIERDSVLGSSSEDDELEADVPTQSIEVGDEGMEGGNSEDEMDWD